MAKQRVGEGESTSSIAKKSGFFWPDYLGASRECPAKVFAKRSQCAVRR